MTRSAQVMPVALALALLLVMVLADILVATLLLAGRVLQRLPPWAAA